MTKTEIMENYTAEQLAEMVVKKDIALEQLAETHAKAVGDAYRKNQILEENNGRLQSKLDTYNNRLLQRCTKEAKEMIDHNHFSGVRIVTWEQWNNRGKADGKVCFPKEYGQTVREFLNIDTSEIQDDCHRFGIESLQRYLKNPAPIKIPKRDDKNMSISDIQKCQDEYEKLLKESPLEGVMDKITKDILEQKNNAMAMEFTRIICDLLKRYGVHVHCTETKFSEKITVNSIEEQYGIVFDSMDFSQHDKEFTDRIKELEEELEKSNREHARTLWEFCDSVKKEDYDSEVNRLKYEVEKYRKAFEYAKKERDQQVCEYQKKVDELYNSLRTLDGNLKVSNAIIENTIKNENGMETNTIKFDNIKQFAEYIKCFYTVNLDYIQKVFWGNEQKQNIDHNITDFLPTEPIKVADMLINASKKRTNCMTGKEYDKYIFDKCQLRQIAEHLLVYCNHNKEEEE